MTDHEEQADQAEAEVDDMSHRSARLEEQISAVREDWERKQRDGAVPGAVGEPPEELPPPEPDETD
jgi:hypothetical protein